MSGRRQTGGDRRRILKPKSPDEERRGRRTDRRISLYERRQRYMDRRQVYDEFWMGARDRRQRVMDRRRKDST